MILVGGLLTVLETKLENKNEKRILLLTTQFAAVKRDDRCNPLKYQFVLVSQQIHEHSLSVLCCCSGVSSHPFVQGLPVNIQIHLKLAN